MNVIEDMAQQAGKHEKKHRYWQDNGIGIIRCPLPVGDYILENEAVMDVIRRKEARGMNPKKMDFLGTYNVCVDSKFSIQELVSDVCGKQHERFRDELILAKNNGIRLIILVENDPEVVYSRNGKHIANHTIHDIRELHKWVNPRLWIFQRGKQKYPTATKGVSLMKACLTMQMKYDCEFRFCSSAESGAEIIKLLGGE